jgi:cobalt-zinc-cadmium efflux system membrane fusion protein
MTMPTESDTVLKHRFLARRLQWQILGAAALTIAVACAGIWLIGHVFAGKAPVTSDEKLPANTFRATDAQLAGLTLAAVTTAPFRTEISADGKLTVNADATTAVYSPYSGRVVKLLAGIGEQVRRGTPLLALEASEYTQALSDLRSAQAQLQLAQQVEKRRQAAFEARGASMQDWQQAQAELVTAENNVAAVRSRLHIFGQADRDIDALAAGTSRPAYTQVVAPIDGVVTDRQVGPGQFLVAGGTSPIYTIADLHTVWVIANVREVDALRLQRGQPMEVRVLAQPDAVLTSHIESVGATVDPLTHRVPVRARLDNASGQLRPEMFVSCTVISGNETSSPAIAAEAIVYEGAGTRVWVLQTAHDISLREVRIGRSSHGLVEVTEGLKVGERVVTGGALFIDHAARPE